MRRQSVALYSHPSSLPFLCLPTRRELEKILPLLLDGNSVRLKQYPKGFLSSQQTRPFLNPEWVALAVRSGRKAVSEGFLFEEVNLLFLTSEALSSRDSVCMVTGGKVPEVRRKGFDNDRRDSVARFFRLP